MNFRHLRCLRGPNVWAACPVIEAALDLGDACSWSSDQVGQALSRVAAELCGTARATAEDSEPPLFRLAWALSRTAQQLQELAGTPVSLAVARATSRPDVFLAAVEFADESVGQAA